MSLDTNEYIHALRRTPGYEASVALFFEHIGDLHVFIPLQVMLELQRNLTISEQTELFDILNDAPHIEWSYDPSPVDRLEYFTSIGAREGDAHVAAQIEQRGIRWLVSENRQFLKELSPLPFEVLSASDVLARL